MALSDEQIKIVIAAELKKQGFDKAQKATSSLEQSFKRLGGTLAATFSVAAITRFAKQSVAAFKEDELAATRLANALKGLNLGFATPEIENYLRNLESQTGVADDQLRPAFQRLAQTTRSVTMSQELLNTAIDISAGSGVDLATVVNDLGRAYVGQTRGLTKYNIGLTQAELRTAKFEDLQAKLNEQFGGARAALLTTYAGKVEMLSTSYGIMQETIGEGLVDAFGMLAGDNGIQGATQAMQEFGTITADVIRGVGSLVGNLTSQIAGDGGLQAMLDLAARSGNPLGQAIAALQKEGAKNRPLFFPSAGIGQPGVERQARAIEEAAIKRQKELEALRVKSIKQQEKLNRLKKIRQMLDKAELKFDERRIQITAALRGNISDEERKRLLELQTIEDLKQAVAEQDLETAEKLLERLNKMQTETEYLAESLIDLKAGDPFEDWEDYFKGANKLVDGMISKLKGIQAEVSKLLTDSQARSAQAAANVLAAKEEKSAAYREAAKATATSASIAESQAASAIAEATAAIASAQTPQERAAAEAFLQGAQAAAEAARVLQESVVAAEEAAALAEYDLAREVEDQARMAMVEAGVPAQTIINIIAEGSIVTEQDLADTLTNLQYDFQRAGRGLLYSAVAI